MVHVYAADLSLLPDPVLRPELMEMLPKERQQKIQRRLQKKARVQSLGAGLLLNAVLPKYKVQPDALFRNEHGKPEIPGVHFNLSHSGDLVVCAVSEKPVGCDVEKLRKAPERFAGHFFCENERNYLKAAADDKYDETFFRLWTLKESYMKMTGEGMSLPLDAFEVMIGEEIHILRDGKKQPCFIKEYTTLGYQVTVCAKEQGFADLIWENLV